METRHVRKLVRPIMHAQGPPKKDDKEVRKVLGQEGWWCATYDGRASQAVEERDEATDHFTRLAAHTSDHQVRSLPCQAPVSVAAPSRPTLSCRPRARRNSTETLHKLHGEGEQ